MSQNVLFFVNFEQGLLKTGQSLDIKIFPIFLVSLATARKHWLGYFSYILCRRKNFHHFQFYKTNLMLCGPPGGPGGHTTSSLVYKTESDEGFFFYIICKEKYLSQCFLAVASETKKMGKI